MVSTRVCGTLSSGSNPDRHPVKYMNKETKITLVLASLFVIVGIAVFIFLLPEQSTSTLPNPILPLEPIQEVKEASVESTKDKKTYTSASEVYRNEELGFSFTYPQKANFTFPESVTQYKYYEPSDKRIVEVTLTNPVPVVFTPQPQSVYAPDSFVGGITIGTEKWSENVTGIRADKKDSNKTLITFLSEEYGLGEEISKGENIFIDGKSAIKIVTPLKPFYPENFGMSADIIFIDIGDHVVSATYFYAHGLEGLSIDSENQLYFIRNEIIDTFLVSLKFF